MGIEQWLSAIALGGLLGMVGQLARAIVGLKKQADAAAARGKTLAECLDGAQLLLSLAIGFVAGTLAIVGLIASSATPFAADGQTIMTLIASGYAGADFIEGFMRRADGTSARKKDDASTQAQRTDGTGASKQPTDDANAAAQRVGNAAATPFPGIDANAVARRTGEAGASVQRIGDALAPARQVGDADPSLQPTDDAGPPPQPVALG